MDLKFFNVKQEDWQSALGVAKAYLRDYPNGKVGFHAGVIYFSGAKDEVYYVYKTKTQLVVRGETKEK